MLRVQAELNNGSVMFSLTYRGEFESALEELNDETGGEYDDSDFSFTLYGTPDYMGDTDIPYESLDYWLDLFLVIEQGGPEAAALEYLVEEEGHAPLTAVDMINDVEIYEGTLEDTAREQVHELEDLPRNLRRYFDFQAYADDQNWFELFADNGRVYTVVNH